jgi:hypothetical protein
MKDQTINMQDMLTLIGNISSGKKDGDDQT